MPNRPPQVCPQRDTTKALANEDLSAAETARAEGHLETCEVCRTLFRQLTVDRLPSFRGYTILKEIDRGGFGIVYKAFHHGKARVEALKVLFGQTEVREAYFQNEVHAVAQLRHPNIATLYEAHLSTPPPYYAMEFVAGQQLDEYFRAHEVSLEERITLLQTIARAIHYAHERGVVHRDLKPQNILIDPDGQPRIVDFGIAKKLGLGSPATDSAAETDRPEGAVGTYGYIPPEQFAGGPVDRRADVYGLGALLFHVITGQPARLARQTRRLTRLLRRQRVSRADDLAAIIARAVDAVPERRYDTCLDLVTDLDNYLAGRPVHARAGESWTYRAGRLALVVLRNHPKAMYAVVVALVTFGLAQVFIRTPARFLPAAAPAGQVVLVAVKPSTIAAADAGELGADLPGFEPANPRSWRLLYGRLFEKLGTARPRAVVWDAFPRSCAPDYDAGLIGGIQALGVPLVIGFADFDLNGEPDLCPEIVAAVPWRGWLGVMQADAMKTELQSALTISRSSNPPLPSLALAGFAAARFPDCVPEVRVQPGHVEVHYRKQEYAEGEPRYLGVVDEIPVTSVKPVGRPKLALIPHDPVLQADDMAARTLFPLDGVEAWAEKAIALEDVLQARTEELAARLGDRVILIGDMASPRDRHRLRDGTQIFGCQGQAQILDHLLTGRHARPIAPPSVFLLVLGWCALAALLTTACPLPTRPAPRATVAGGLAAIAGGLLLADATIARVLPLWALQAGFALSALLCVGGVVLPLRALRERQMRLTPGPVWVPDALSSTSTVVVQPAESGSRA